MTGVFTVLGTLIAAVALWWGHFRAGRLAFFGVLSAGPSTSTHSFLRIELEAKNSGPLTVQLCGLVLVQDGNGVTWGLNKLAVDGRAVDFRRAAVTFTGSERHRLSCEFFSTHRNPVGSMIFFDLEVDERNFLRERKRRAYSIQVNFGEEIELIFPGSVKYCGVIRGIQAEERERNAATERHEKAAVEQRRNVGR